MCGTVVLNSDVGSNAVGAHLATGVFGKNLSETRLWSLPACVFVGNSVSQNGAKWLSLVQA